MTPIEVVEGKASSQDVFHILQQGGVEVFNNWREENPEVEINLTGMDLKRMNLSGVNLSRANLMEAIFWGANFQKANFSEATLCLADFWLADLREANFCGADLWRVDFSGADLRQANFSWTDLREANFSKETDFSGANFWGVLGIPQDILKKYLVELKNSICLAD